MPERGRRPQPHGTSAPSASTLFAHPRAQAGVRRILGGWRIGLAALELVAILGNLAYVLGFSAFGTANFFWYFTIQTAFAAVPVFAVTGVIAARGRAERPALATLRTVVLTHLLLSGGVFAIIVAQASSRDYRIEVPWSDVLLHFVVPAAALLDWLVDRFLAPPAVAIPWRALAWSLPFPAVWLACTLLRGEIVGWYPYFFLDPLQVSGPLEIAGWCALVLVIMVSLTAALAGVSRRRCLPARDPMSPDAGARVGAPVGEPAAAAPATDQQHGRSGRDSVQAR
ncbi:Pr6Pr family membrane protein [Rathayibacter sp. YIM 133350]|uniref:Pr6Pr family membrane protein n=1 Tax=Rathayibacter sp. YIM 133350 TaxID=3131992 RepID=UPI00307CD219